MTLRKPVLRSWKARRPWRLTATRRRAWTTGRVMDLLNAAESSPPEILEALQESASSIHKSITIL